jgi:hypothetical protein
MRGERVGIRFRNTVSDSALVRNRHLAQGAGVALGDVDGDGLVDVFLARTEGPNALYRNLGGWKFEDITRQAGIAAPDRYSTGAVLVDVEGDGDLDLILLATNGPNAIFVNDGRGRFTERRDLGLDPAGEGGTSIAMADVDGDGTLDLYVANYKPNSPLDEIPPPERTPQRMTREVAPGRFEVRPEYQRDYKLVMRPDLGGLNLSIRAAPDAFYLNRGGRFERVVQPSDWFLDPAGRPASPDESFTLAARFADLDGDGAPELYAVNDFEDPDLLWFNDGRGQFRLADWTAIRQMSNSSMGVDVGDVDGDGLPDLYVVDMLSHDSRRLKTQIPTHIALPKRPGQSDLQLQLQRNTLFLNRGDRTFAEVASYAGLEASGWSWATMLLDVDLDGWQDVLITTGHLWDVMDADTQEQLERRLPDVPWQRLRWMYPALPLRNLAFRNRGDLTFEDASVRWRFGIEEDYSHAIAAADLDGDGDLDLVINRLHAPVLVLRNDAPAPRIAVRLVGDPPNTRAVGAKVRVKAADPMPLQEREVAAGGLYLSHSDYLAVFATGSAAEVTIEVDWRDGRRTVLSGARPGRLYEITTAAAATFPGTTPAEGTPLFEDATAQLRGHTHWETPFDDWRRQYLLPHALSQLGPGVAWFDMDRDGDEDLFVGTGAGGRLAAFRNDRGRLVPWPGWEPGGRRGGGGFVAPGDLTAIVGAVLFGIPHILAGVSSWEAESPDAVRSYPAVVSFTAVRQRPGVETATVVPASESATGPLALADYDGDGDLDLFVGGRALPGRYPEAASSRLFRNNGAGFQVDEENSARLVQVGLVSAALFADLDGDGFPELVLARDWGSLLVLRNERGRLVPVSGSLGLERWTGRWNGLAAGDVDGDGRLDLVATNWGRNTGVRADSARPLYLVHGRFGAYGGVEMLMARYDERVRGLAPLNSFGRARVAVAGLATRLPTFGAYADATVEEVLGPFAGATERLTVVTLDHMVFLNRGTGFEARPLPREAQFAPAFYAGVADFDGDGAEDVFLSQNFYPTAQGLPRHDAGRGLLLLGGGGEERLLLPVPGRRSGIVVYGDQRGAAYADFDGDGRLDLVVSQNAETTRLFRNRGARPGLRVRLVGPPGNPDGIGAQIRVVYHDRMGPVREVQAGSGYWSQNGAVQVLGLAAAPVAVWVRWPGGAESRVPIPAGVTTITIRP